MKQNKYSDQYNSLYCKRLEVLRPKIQATAKKLWINNKKKSPELLERTIDITPGQEVILIGTLVKESKLLPTVLEQYTKEVRNDIFSYKSEQNSTKNELIIYF